MHLIANNIDGMIVMSELTRMRSGETYNCLDDELKLMRAKPRSLYSNLTTSQTQIYVDNYWQKWASN